MTVAVDAELRIREYAGDDSANPRAVPFYFLDNDDLTVTCVNADGSDTVLVRGSDYTVSGAGNPAGGSVTPLAPIASGTSWRIEGNMPLEQPTDYTAGDDFSAESHERGLDRSMIGLQEVRRDVNDVDTRAVKVERGAASPPRLSMEGMLDGDVLAYRGGRLRRLDLLASAGKWAAINGLGQIIGADGFDASVVPAIATNIEIDGGGTVQQAITVVTPEMTGEADPGDAFVAAIDRVIAAGGGTVQLKPGEIYAITSEIHKEIPDGIELRIIGTGAKIDLTSFDDPTGPIIRLGGKRTATNTTFASSVAKGDVTFDVESATGLAKGKLLLITSTDLFNPTRPYYYKGEIVQVTDVTGNTVRISCPLYDSYDHETTTLHLLDMPRIVWEGVEIVCDGNVRALELAYVRNPIVTAATIHGARYSAIYVNFYFGGLIDRNLIYDCWRTGTGTSYGISPGTGQGLKVIFNQIGEVRHAVAAGGNEPCRDLIIQGNTGPGDTREMLTGSIDAHGNCENIQIIDNVTSAYTIAGRNVILRPGTFTNTAAAAPAILIFQEIDSDYYKIESGAGECLVSGAQGIWLSPVEPDLHIGVLRIAGLGIEAQSPALFIQPRTSDDTGCSIGRLELDGNNFVAHGSGAYAARIANNGAATYRIGEIVSTGNLFDGPAGRGLNVEPTNDVERHVSVADTYRGNESSSYLADFSADDVVLEAPNFVGNSGGAGNSRSVRFLKSGGRVRVSNPTFSGLDYRAELESGTVASYAETGVPAGSPHVLNNAGATRTSDEVVSVSATDIAAVGNLINIINKFAGKIVWDTTNKRQMRASGPAAGDAWDVIDGSASVTPA